MKRHLPLDPGATWRVCVQGAPLYGIAVAVPTAFAEVKIRPAADMLGLARFDDAEPQEHDGSPNTIFEVEKLVRMALHQSVLAFEILAGPGIGADVFDADFVFENAFTDRLIENTLRAAKSGLHPDDAEWRRGVRQTMQAAAVQIGVATTSANALVAVLGDEYEDVLHTDGDPGRAVKQAQELFAVLESRDTVLPAQPKGYDALSDWLVQLRLNG